MPLLGSALELLYHVSFIITSIIKITEIIVIAMLTERRRLPTVTTLERAGNVGLTHRNALPANSYDLDFYKGLHDVVLAVRFQLEILGR